METFRCGDVERIIAVGTLCFECLPCKHTVRVHLKSGIRTEALMFGPDIGKKVDVRTVHPFDTFEELKMHCGVDSDRMQNEPCIYMRQKSLKKKYFGNQLSRCRN